ncbi:MAG: M10 family metallopeptidase C-terminal domain-containing protein [Pseudomonadota bacterium]
MCQICAAVNPFTGDWIHAGLPALPALEEVADAPAGPDTPYTLDTSQGIDGRLVPDDVDWIRLEVTQGSTFTLELQDVGGVSDTHLSLYNASGTRVATDDDGGAGFLSALTHVAQGEVYFAAVTTYETFYDLASTDTGIYRLVLDTVGGDTTKPMLSDADFAAFLTDGYWTANGLAPRAFDISIPKSDGGSDAEDEGAPPDSVITVDYSGLTAAGQWFAAEALAAWSALTGLAFQAVASGAQIVFDDTESGAQTLVTVGDDGIIQHAHINVSRGWIEGDHYEYDAYSLQTFLHEIGHALGLGHAGNYDHGPGDGAPVTYDTHASFANDSWQATVMSYFSQSENPNTAASRAYLLTPMAADLDAIAALYGSASSLRTGDTIYGIGSTAGDFYDALEGTWGAMAFTIVDHGGYDRLDFSDTDAVQWIDLGAGAVSGVGGLVGNMVIARGTRIEEVRSGAGGDSISGNSADNRIEAGAGNDMVLGARGNDQLFGGAGADTLGGGWSDDTLKGGKGADSLIGGDGFDRLEGQAGDDNAHGGKRADFIHGGSGHDSLDGEDGRDTLHGGWGEDTLLGGAGRDNLRGAGGNDRLEGGAGNDRLGGNSGNDNVRGNEGDDKIFGGANDDTLGGGDGDDRLAGQRGSDRIWGGAGDDLILGNSGDDTLTGGTGADTFAFKPGDGHDRITDFALGEDRIDLSHFSFGSAADALAMARDAPGGVTFDFEGGETLILEGIALASLGADDMIL